MKRRRGWTWWLSLVVVMLFTLAGIALIALAAGAWKWFD